MFDIMIEISQKGRKEKKTCLVLNLTGLRWYEYRNQIFLKKEANTFRFPIHFTIQLLPVENDIGNFIIFSFFSFTFYLFFSLFSFVTSTFVFDRFSIHTKTITVGHRLIESLSKKANPDFGFSFIYSLSNVQNESRENRKRGKPTRK